MLDQHDNEPYEVWLERSRDAIAIERNKLLTEILILKNERNDFMRELDEMRGLLREVRNRLPPRNAYLREPLLEDLRNRIDIFLAINEKEQ